MTEARRKEDSACKDLAQRLTDLGCLVREVENVLVVVYPAGTRAQVERLTAHLTPDQRDLRPKQPLRFEGDTGLGGGGVRPLEARGPAEGAVPELPPPPPPVPVIRLPEAFGLATPLRSRAAARGDIGGDVDNG